MNLEQIQSLVRELIKSCDTADEPALVERLAQPDAVVIRHALYAKLAAMGQEGTRKRLAAAVRVRLGLAPPKEGTP